MARYQPAGAALVTNHCGDAHHAWGEQLRRIPWLLCCELREGMIKGFGGVLCVISQAGGVEDKVWAHHPHSNYQRANAAAVALLRIRNGWASVLSTHSPKSNVLRGLNSSHRY